jgi:glycine hydroxymethyltransferase
MHAKDTALKTRTLVEEHTKWFSQSLSMIASENLISPLAREMLISDLCDRYAEGLPGKRYYQGLVYIDQIETTCIELAKTLFNAPYADVRPISATVANIGLLFALTQPGDVIMAHGVSDGGHISSARFGAVGVRGVTPVAYPFDLKNMNIDVDAAIKAIRAARPRLCLFGMSLFLFPLPLRELADAVREVNANAWYDGAHVMGLIAGGQFQDPLREGMDVLSGSTHKTLPGPQHGIILANPKDEKVAKKLNSSVFPGVVSNHHLHSVAALAVTLAEHIEFGRAYAEQVCKNARALGQALHERGFEVLCPHLGFTRSHMIAVDVSKRGGGRKVVEDLEKANIITNKNLLPWDQNTKSMDPSGVRLGVQELTRIGMREHEMSEVAELFKRLVIDGEPHEKVRDGVINLRSGFTKIHYCFHDGTEAYKHYKIV